MNIFWIKFDPNINRRVKESAGVIVDKYEYTTAQKTSITLGKMKTYTTYDFFTGEIGYWAYVFGIPTKICKTPEELRQKVERICYGILDDEENSRLSLRWTISGHSESLTSQTDNERK